MYEHGAESYSNRGQLVAGHRDYLTLNATAEGSLTYLPEPWNGVSSVSQTLDLEVLQIVDSSDSTMNDVQPHVCVSFSIRPEKDAKTEPEER